jgi:hypothetical protein
MGPSLSRGMVGGGPVCRDGALLCKVKILRLYPGPTNWLYLSVVLK